MSMQQWAAIFERFKAIEARLDALEATQITLMPSEAPVEEPRRGPGRPRKEPVNGQ